MIQSLEHKFSVVLIVKSAKFEHTTDWSCVWMIYCIIFLQPHLSLWSWADTWDFCRTPVLPRTRYQLSRSDHHQPNALQVVQFSRTASPFVPAGVHRPLLPTQPPAARAGRAVQSLRQDQAQCAGPPGVEAVLTTGHVLNVLKEKSLINGGLDLYMRLDNRTRHPGGRPPCVCEEIICPLIPHTLLTS